MYTRSSGSIRRALLGFGTAATLLATGLVAAPAGAACGPAQEAETFVINARSLAKAYQVGSTAKIALRVTRGSDDLTAVTRSAARVDLAAPVEGASVFARITVGKTVLAAMAITNESGRATISVPIHKATQAGLAQVNMRAWYEHSNGACHFLTEYGDLRVRQMFSVRR